VIDRQKGQLTFVSEPLLKCVQCPQPAEVNFRWPTSLGQQEADLCGACAAAAWAKFGQTPAFQGLIIKDVRA
jgi:hypothetical protein